MPSDNAELIARLRTALGWSVRRDALCIEAADALFLADRLIEELTARCAAMEAVVAAARVRGAYWHNDTCAQVLIENSYACSCGKDALIAALAALDAK